jgi:hypothetical protein
MHGTKISAKAPRAMMGLSRRKRFDRATSPLHSSSVTILLDPFSHFRGELPVFGQPGVDRPPRIVVVANEDNL